jgi:phosphoglycerate dehydrogenase-like enzyme
MEPTAYLISTARGRIVNEPELIRVLQTETIAAPLSTSLERTAGNLLPPVPMELRKLDNVILAPHDGGRDLEPTSAAVGAG